MARTPFFGTLQSLIGRALWEERNPGLGSLLEEASVLSREGSELDRRRFLQWTLSAGAAALPMASLLRSGAGWASSGAGAQGPVSVRANLATYKSNAPVSILGAGAAGLTAAYRLMKAGVACEVFEASHRVGGRIFTRKGFNADGMFIEQGAELVDSGHAELRALAAELNVEVEDFRAADAGLEKEVYFFRGRRLLASDVLSQLRPLGIRLARDIAAVFPDPRKMVVNYRVFNESARRFDQMSLATYLDGMRGDVERWVLDLISQAYTGEMGLDASEQSALGLLTLIDPETNKGLRLFGESDEAMRIKGGNSRLMDALHKAIQAKVPIHLGHELVKWEKKNADFTLHFSGASGTTQTLKAEQVLCTIPFSVLRRVHGTDGLGLSPVKSRSIREVGYGTNSKLSLGFRDRLWRQTAGDRKGCAGMFFTDLEPQSFWETSRLQSGQRGILCNFSGGSFGRKLNAEMIPLLLDALEKMQPGLRDRFEQKHAIMNWSNMPWARGSYSCLKPGQFTSLHGSESEPEMQGRLLFAGEHCSQGYQGYMNGGIETGAAAARECLIQRGKAKA